jgi:hypothetical protein
MGSVAERCIIGRPVVGSCESRQLCASDGDGLRSWQVTKEMWRMVGLIHKDQRQHFILQCRMLRLWQSEQEDAVDGAA